MRPTANFTLHAILAACLVAFAASSAAAGPAGDAASQGFFQMRLGASASGGRGQQLEVQSYQWGALPAGYKLDRVYVKSWSTSGDANSPPPRDGGRNQLRMEDRAGAEHTMQPGSGGGGAAAGRVTGIASDPADPASVSTGGVTVGAGDVNDARSGKYLTARPRPADQGSLRVSLSAPWAACRVGARFPSLAFSDGGKRYLLRNVQVVECGGSSSAPHEDVSFAYSKIDVQ